MKFILLIFSFFTIISPNDSSYIEMQNTENDSAFQQNNIELVGSTDYENLSWRMLLSQEETDFYMAEIAKYALDPNYEGGIAPTPGVNLDLDGKKVKITGFAVGVDSIPGEYNRVKTFLFVPTEGSCIHIPPPPPNQTIFVQMRRSVRTDPYEPIILEGTIFVEEGNSEIGSYFYRFEGDSIRDYER